MASHFDSSLLGSHINSRKTSSKVSSSPLPIDNMSNHGSTDNLLVKSPSIHKEWFDPIPEDERFTTLPVGRRELWNMHKTQQRGFWTVEEVDLSKDAEQYQNVLSEGERRAVRHILAFFAASDSLVNVNILGRFRVDVPMPEAGYFYNTQSALEDIHGEMYSLSLETIISDKAERDVLFNAMKSMPVIAKMTAYIMSTINSDDPFPKRLLRMACVEGVFFTGCFCLIYWFGSRNNLMPGLVQSNELIARDEGLHTKFALMLYSMLKEEHKLSTNEIAEIIEEAVDISLEFTLASLPEAMEEMNADLMTEYIKLMGNNIAAMIGEDPIYQGVKNPFSFMDQLNTQRKANFFEKRATQYAKKTARTAEVVVTTDNTTDADSEKPKSIVKKGYKKGAF